MKFLDSLRFRIASLFHRSDFDADIDEELRSHMQHRADDLERSGVSRGEAERRARLEFGGQAKFREQTREAAGGRFIESVFQDLRFAARMLRKSPGFAAITVITLALAIGANAVVFGLLNSLIFRPLNVPDSQSLYAPERKASFLDPSQSYPDYLDMRDRNRSFDGMAGFTAGMASMDAGDSASRSWMYEVTGNYFDELRLQPFLGSFFHASDEHGPDSVPYVVLTYAYWHSRFQDDRNVVGRTIQLNKHPFTILGVAPPGFHGTLLIFSPDFFVPMIDAGLIDGTSFLNSRQTRWVFMTFGHLKPGVTKAQAIADLDSIGSSLGKNYPKDDAQMTFTLARPALYGDYLGRPFTAFLTALMLLAGLILLAACANLGSLFAARATDRSRELAMRVALGSSPARMLRQLFTEAILVALIGGALGLWGSVNLLQAISVWQPMPGVSSTIPVTADANVYIAALVLALASGFLFGAVPVKQVLRTNPYEVIKSGSAVQVGQKIHACDILLGVQVAICALLVTCSMVAVRGLLRTLHGNFGFEPRNAMVVNDYLNLAGYSGDKVPVMQKRMIDSLRTIPGVSAIGMIDGPPLNEGWNSFLVYEDKTADLRPTNASEVVGYSISPGYFQAAATPLLAGRTFIWNDDANSTRVAVVNNEFARRIFGSAAKAMGGYYKMQDGTRIQVVGIVADGKYTNVAEDPHPAMFRPILQAPSGDNWIVVRSATDPQYLAAAIRSKLRGLDSGLPFLVETWDQKLTTALLGSRIATTSLGVLGLLGSLLSVTGIFGLAAYTVSKRRRELGIRIALGAQRRELLEAALGKAVRLLAWGSAAGLVIGILAGRALSFIIYRATPLDPVALAAVIVAMALLGLLGTWMPARRALALDPLVLLREE
jgi:predicted permease